MFESMNLNPEVPSFTFRNFLALDNFFSVFRKMRPNEPAESLNLRKMST